MGLGPRGGGIKERPWHLYIFLARCGRIYCDGDISLVHVSEIFVFPSNAVGRWTHPRPPPSSPSSANRRTRPLFRLWLELSHAPQGE